MIIDFIYFDSNSIRLANGDAHYIFYSYMDTSTVVMQTKFRRTSIKYPLRDSLLNDRTTWMNISRSIISDAPHFIGPAWKTVPVSLNSSALSCLGGTQRAFLTGKGNNTRYPARIDRARLARE